MLATPVGRLTIAEENGRLMLADAAAFRTWCNASTQAEALARIHPDAIPGPGSAREFTLEELRAARPYAILNIDPEGGYVREAHARESDGTYNTEDSGRVDIRFEQDVPPKRAHDLQGLFRDVKNSMGQIIDDMIGLAGRAVYLNVIHYVAFGPYRSQVNMHETQGDVIMFRFVLTWGRLS